MKGDIYRLRNGLKVRALDDKRGRVECLENKALDFHWKKGEALQLVHGTGCGYGPGYDIVEVVAEGLLIEVGQIWQEADNRHKRLVEVLEVGLDQIAIITIFDSIKPSRAWRPTKAKRSRFKSKKCTSHCGYYRVDYPEGVLE